MAEYKTGKELVDYEMWLWKDNSWILVITMWGQSKTKAPILRRAPKKGSHIHCKTVKTEQAIKHVKTTTENEKDNLISVPALSPHEILFLSVLLKRSTKFILCFPLLDDY